MSGNSDFTLFAAHISIYGKQAKKCNCSLFLYDEILVCVHTHTHTYECCLEKQ